jgi:hypothetical protein
MAHLLRIIGMTAFTLLLIGAAFAIAINGAALSGYSVHLEVAGVGGHRMPAMSDPCVSAARMAETTGQPTMC